SAPTPTTSTYTLSLHDALPILRKRVSRDEAQPGDALLYHLTLRNLSNDVASDPVTIVDRFPASLRLSATSVRIDGQSASGAIARSEEHTSELQSRENLVCRLLL